MTYILPSPECTRWAVALGANTPARLALEHCISEKQARESLAQCVRLGLIRDMQDGTYHARPMEMSE